MIDTERAHPWAAALGRIPSGLFILTARRDELETGMLASWVQQCSFEPPLVTVALRKDRLLKDWLKPGDGFVINVLGDSQKDMIVFFARGIAPAEKALESLPLERTAGGVAVLARALAFLECRVEQCVSAGDHDLIVGQVVGGQMLNEGQPMVHVRKNGLRY
jgi:flavin reductase (DIM6/NTAB) family NADH-FMN oxidoreductase RutF